jgi:hypothetical protein
VVSFDGWEQVVSHDFKSLECNCARMMISSSVNEVLTHDTVGPKCGVIPRHKSLLPIIYKSEEVTRCNVTRNANRNRPAA